MTPIVHNSNGKSDKLGSTITLWAAMAVLIVLCGMAISTGFRASTDAARAETALQIYQARADEQMRNIDLTLVEIKQELKTLNAKVK